MDKRRRIQGVVFSNKNDKTIGVMLSGYKKHSKYLKRVQFRSQYYADDPKNEAKVGDVVTIEECRPISKTKRFKLISIDKKAPEDIKVVDEEGIVSALHEDKEEKKEAAKEAKAATIEKPVEAKEEK